MNKKIKDLNKQLENVQSNASDIEMQLQAEWNEVFRDSTKIKEMVSKVGNSRKYTFDQYGEIAAYVNVDLSDFEECKEYFEVYMRDEHCTSVQWEYGALLLNCGPDNIIIQDDTRHDNGVWLNSKCVIDESEYKEDGEVDETKRNALIEAYMEKTGYFPGVFRCDSHGNVFLVNTKGN